ncbi:MAG: DUF2911 domain-containing protein [Lewinellaceae bacterium]|nr:DUF2911 domain-containing protein [Saprospiraceae bacterium]MCB9331733.1 DUF2911 domain-containing protein [Lewinellaceae bacterium]
MKNTARIYVSAILLFALGSISQLTAQDDKSTRPSPPATATATTGDLTIKIDYSSPGVKGRQVLGKLIPDGKIWRLGANEATTFEVNKDVLVEGQKLAAGKYAMFSMQDGGDWTIIFNTVPNQWGAYKYDESKDALRVVVSPGKTDDMVERMAFKIEATKEGAAEVLFNWEYIEVKFDVAAADQK